MKGDHSRRVLTILTLALACPAAAFLAGLCVVVWTVGPSMAAEKPEAAVPPGYTTTRTGTMHDFDDLEGGWTSHQRRLKATGVGSTEWEEFPATICMELHLGGVATVDEMYMPTRGRAGLTLWTFDLEKRQWSIYWLSSTTGRLEPEPHVVGGFDGNRGEFYAADEMDGRPIKVRYLWTKIDHDHARWEQAFSYDNRTWETNWIGELERADATKVCEGSRPRR